MNNIEKQFIEELNTLLKKYDAEINIDEYVTGYPEIVIYGFKDGKEIKIVRKWFDGEE